MTSTPSPTTTSCPLPFLSFCVASFALHCRNYYPPFPRLSSHCLLLLIPPHWVPGASCPLAFFLPSCVHTTRWRYINIYWMPCAKHPPFYVPFCMISLSPHDNPFSSLLSFLFEVKAQGHSATKWQSWDSNPGLFESRLHSLAKITHWAGRIPKMGDFRGHLGLLFAPVRSKARLPREDYKEYDLKLVLDKRKKKSFGSSL